jgi:hypothetical protein
MTRWSVAPIITAANANLRESNFPPPTPSDVTQPPLKTPPQRTSTSPKSSVPAKRFAGVYHPDSRANRAKYAILFTCKFKENPFCIYSYENRVRSDTVGEITFRQL